MTSLKKLAVNSAIWTIAGYGAGQIIRFGSNLILTRLLVPEYFGVMAVLNTLRIGLELFSDIGIGQSIIQNRRGEEAAFLKTAWTVQVIRGIGLWLMCCLLAWPASLVYGQRFLWLVPIIGLVSLIDGFGTVSIHTLHRDLALDKYTLFDLLTQTLGILSIILLALWWPSLWALVIGGILGSFLRLVAGHLLFPNPNNRFAWDQSCFQEIYAFGKWLFAATALMFLADQSDRLILGKIFSFQILGIYSIAYTLANMPREVIKTLGYRVIFTAIAKQADLPRSQLRGKIVRQRLRLLLLLAVGLAGLTAIGDRVIYFLYDKRYEPATWMMPILCLGIWFSILFNTVSPALLAVGKPLYSAQSNLARLMMILVGIPLGFHLGGVVGAIVAISFSDLFPYLVVLYGLWREKLLCLIQDLQTTVVFVGALAILLVLRYSLGFGTPIDLLLKGS